MFNKPIALIALTISMALLVSCVPPVSSAFYVFNNSGQTLTFTDCDRRVGTIAAGDVAAFSTHQNIYQGEAHLRAFGGRYRHFDSSCFARRTIIFRRPDGQLWSYRLTGFSWLEAKAIAVRTLATVRQEPELAEPKSYGAGARYVVPVSINPDGKIYLGDWQVITDENGWVMQDYRTAVFENIEQPSGFPIHPIVPPMQAAHQ